MHFQSGFDVGTVYQTGWGGAIPAPVYGCWKHHTSYHVSTGFSGGTSATYMALAPTAIGGCMGTSRSFT